MELQNFEKINGEIEARFLRLREEDAACLAEPLKLSWSNWCFGRETLETSAKRLQANGIGYIELHGNHYGKDLGYRAAEVRAVLSRCNLSVSGICGMFSPENNLSDSNPHHRQAALDYLKRTLEFGHEVGAGYLLVVPGAVGRPIPQDGSEWERSAETLRLTAPLFQEAGVRGAIEPIRAAEVSLVHTFAEAKRYIDAVDSPWIRWINGDVYHMQAEERSIPEAILGAGQQLLNLHLADSNRRAMGMGAMDLDSVLMALYVIGYTKGQTFITPEPLGPGGDPYPAMHGKMAEEDLDELVRQTADYVRARETELLNRLQRAADRKEGGS